MIAATILSVAVPTAAALSTLNSLALHRRGDADVVSVSFSGTGPAYRIVKRNGKTYEVTFSGTRLGSHVRGEVRGKVVQVRLAETPFGSRLTATGSHAIELHVNRHGPRFALTFDDESRAGVR